MTGDSDSEEIRASPEPGRKAATRTRSRVPDHEIAEVRDVQFPTAMRGYDRAAVDAYVSRVNRLLAELQITAAPESAIRHALDEVADETRGLLERAHETAEEITRRSRTQADDRVQLAEGEADEVRKAADDYAREIRAVADKQLHALQADADRIWEERGGILGELRDLAGQLERVAAQADERYPSRPDLEPHTTAAPSAPSPPPPADEEAGEEPAQPSPLDED
jgi:cell division initiation protein